jgi:uncharacterized damage-inducible protein DinB
MAASMKVLRLLSVVFLIAALPLLAAKPVPHPSAAAQGFRAEFIANLDEVQDKILSLAEATPAEAYAWKPGSGVRSVSEVYMHLAGGNYFLSTFLGQKPPKMNGDLEKTVTKKADVIAELKRSFDHLRAAANSVKDLEKPVKMFGNNTSQRGVMVTMLSHLHEHLGQSVAYARMNSVVPPWSR